jgi:hypothetical protein
MVGARFVGVVAGGHRHADNSVGGIRPTPTIRPASSLMGNGLRGYGPSTIPHLRLAR